MSKETIQYYKDRLKNSAYKKISGLEKKLKTTMQSILLQVELKGLLPEKITAIEMFGMHGLWHTMDYISYVDSLDIFEINKKYHELSKKKLKKFNTNFYCEDSIKYISETNKKYNFIVADIPHSGPFYDTNGLPLFFKEMVRIADQDSIMIINFHSSNLIRFQETIDLIHEKCGLRKVKDVFFVPKNKTISYLIIALK